jgi:hypothetical protein
VTGMKQVEHAVGEYDGPGLPPAPGQQVLDRPDFFAGVQNPVSTLGLKTI